MPKKSEKKIKSNQKKRVIKGMKPFVEHKYPIVRVRWVDAHSSSGWFSKEEAVKWSNRENSYYAENVGYLIEETKEGIVLAARIADDGDLGMLQRIPSPWVKKVIHLPPQKRKR